MDHRPKCKIKTNKKTQLRENIGRKYKKIFCDLGSGKDFLVTTPKYPSIK